MSLLRDDGKKHEKAIFTAAFSAAAAGLPGAFVPILDIGAISTIWVTMILHIGKKSGRHLDHNTVLKVVTSLLAASTAYLAGTKILTFTLNVVPGLGTIGAIGLNCLLNFIYTCRLGQFIAQQMEKSTFDMEDWAPMIKQVATIVFAVPTLIEIRDAWGDWNSNQEYNV